MFWGVSDRTTILYSAIHYEYSSRLWVLALTFGSKRRHRPPLSQVEGLCVRNRLRRESGAIDSPQTTAIRENFSHATTDASIHTVAA
jgi:hypothetical protein